MSGEKIDLMEAATNADWEQVRLNGGQPCFHIEDRRFCFRAERWAGHPTFHEFVTLRMALAPFADSSDNAEVRSDG